MRLLPLVLLLLAACQSSSSPADMPTANSPVIPTSTASPADPDREAIEAVLAQYNAGTATRDSEAFAEILHADARQYVAGPRFMALDTPTYLQLLSNGTIGGVERTMTVHEVVVDGLVASAHVTFDSAPAQFDNVISLVKFDGAWQIVSVAVEMTPNG